jgi:hypothetical protein
MSTSSDLSGHTTGQRPWLLSERLAQAGFAADSYDVLEGEALRQGHFILGVSVGEHEVAKQRAADALRGADAEFIKYYADNYVEDLGAGG